MASLQEQAEAVKAAVTSVATCTPAITALLKHLLPDDTTETSIAAPRDLKITKTPRTTKTKQNGAASKPANASKKAAADKAELPAKEKALLATSVINATLKSLGEAAKAPPAMTPKKLSAEEEDLAKTTTRRRIRRSNSAPMTPLHPSALNKVSTSPEVNKKPSKPTANPSTTCLSTVECARVAFSALRCLQNTDKIRLPELQLEAGTSSLVGKLVNLDLTEHAVKELRMLKKRLCELGTGKTKSSRTAISAPSVSFADLLDFHDIKASGQVLSLIVNTQIQALRVLSKLKRPADIQAAIPFLRETTNSSPTSFLLQSAESSEAERVKAARLLETVSQLILALAPNVSISEDDAAVGSKVSISPASALELQTIALQTRLQWWKLAGHRADVDTDLFSPLSKCIAAYVRRTQKTQSFDYKTLLNAFNKIDDQARSQKLEPSKSLKSPLASIYQALAKLARESGYYSEAILWVERLVKMADRSQESAAKHCAMSALLLAHRLRMAWKFHNEEELMKEVIEGLQGSLRGDSTELEELLDSLLLVRKSTMHIIVGNVVDEGGKKYQPSQELSELLESFILQMPRFCLRWLGKRPSSKDITKDFLRYEQRRSTLGNSMPQVMDSVLMLTKTAIDEKRIPWDKLDSLLNDCQNLLDALGDHTPAEYSSQYYSKISHLYYIQHVSLTGSNQKSRKDSKDFALGLKALRRSVDAVKHRPRREQEKAQILYKLELICEFYRESGRLEDSLGSLQTLRSILIGNGVLSTVASSLKTSPPRKAWAVEHDAQSLSWVLKAMCKIGKSWVDWTTQLDEPERLAALEHRLEFILSKAGKGIDPSDPSVDALLQICSTERYPVRRLRVLLRLLIANIGNEERLRVIKPQVEDAASISDTMDLKEDVGLKDCFPHMKALATSVNALAHSSPDFPKIEKSISTWQTIFDSSKNVAELDKRIDDLPSLMEHMQSIADCARLSNRNSLALKALQLSSDLGRKATQLDTALYLQISAALALQLTDVGQSSQAAVIFEEGLGSRQHQNARCHEETIRFLLSYAEYYVEIGKVEKADELLQQAKEIASRIELSSRSRGHKLMMAQTSFLYSSVALGRGDAPCALTHARNATRVVFQEWSRLENQAKQVSPENSSASADESGTKLDVSSTEAGERSKGKLHQISGPEAWKLAQPVFKGLLFLSNTYAHLGMYQETVYYAEQAQKVAQAASSEAYLAESDACMSLISSRAGKLEDALSTVREVKPLLDGGDYSRGLVQLYCQLSNIYRQAKDFEAEKSMIEAAEAMVSRMAELQGSANCDAKLQNARVIEEGISRPAVREKRVASKPRISTKSVPRKAAPTKSAPTISSSSFEPDDAHLSSLKASIMVEKASSMLQQKDWTAAWQILQETRKSSKLVANILSELVATARSLLGQSMDEMANDAVFSVVQESTLSFPSISCGLTDKAERFSVIKASPPRTVAAATVLRDIAKCPSQGYLENLREARECLLEAHALASVLGDGRIVHKTLSMLQTVVILLSAASSSSKKTGVLGHPGYATCSVEMARNLTWRREQKALLSEKSSGRAGLEWPEEVRTSEARRTSLSPVVDMTKFQREYIDIIPQEWSVISISLSDNRNDLCISKLQGGQSPFVIRLPLERATSRDADSEVFNFQEGRTELLELIKRANATCHDKRDFSVKGAKTAWWTERTSLDMQLKELLEKIQQIWLGGFKGIFSQHQRHPELLAKFQQGFQGILDKHLPSRRQVRGKKTKIPTSRIALDLRILELFIGLGDATSEEGDFEEMLNDLLYFVVDILQFHGERNAYDEIDFDAMVVDTTDALLSYHDAAGLLQRERPRSHTILVLDKALHTFPWESMPCLQGLAVSRVPSLACLRRLILEQRARSHKPSDVGESKSQTEQNGHHVSIDNGTYILNPSGDLNSTQSMFEAPLSSSLSPSWKRIQGKAPTEPEFETTLSSSDILLYMGHGGGAQYVRNRTIRRLDKCRATALLMGCSSASLTDVGEFEVYGLVWSYMLAGCPAVVGTLWDVTDKDIDLYTGRLFEEWGLVGKGTFQAHVKADYHASSSSAAAAANVTVSGNTNKASASSSRKRAAGDGDTACEYGNASLPEAVAQARNAGVCKFKYLNAGAVCVYGIPVYVDRSGS